MQTSGLTSSSRDVSLVGSRSLGSSTNISISGQEKRGEGLSARNFGAGAGAGGHTTSGLENKGHFASLLYFFPLRDRSHFHPFQILKSGNWVVQIADPVWMRLWMYNNPPQITVVLGVLFQPLFLTALHAGRVGAPATGH